MPLLLHRLPVDQPALPAVAAWLLAAGSDPAPEDLAQTLVLLPSSRACTQLGQALLEASGNDALLLPRILTPARLADHLASLLAVADESLPDAALRPLILAPRMAELAWLRDRPEAAPGLAAELVDLFDEVRLARREAWILEGSDDESLMQLAGPGAEDVLQTDLARIRDAWRLYREVLPRDQVDVRVEALTTAAVNWPGTLPSVVVAAHFARLDEVTLALLRGLSVQGVLAHWLTISADDPRSRLLLATYRDASGWSHPLAGVHRLAELNTGQCPVATWFAGGRLNERAEELGDARDQLAHNGPLRLMPCRDPEHESRVVAVAVCQALDGADPVPEIVIATPDRDLAARIAAQLRDAGVDVDDTRGRQLAGLPAGRLLRDVLRTAVAGWPFGPLFELLTHPYVRLGEADARPNHAVRVQLLEAAVRRSGTARRGLKALRKLALADDEQAGDRRQGWALVSLVDDLRGVLAPLTDIATGPVAWAAAIDALHAVWQVVAPDRPLDGDPDPRRDHDDVGAVAGLLGALRDATPHLPDAPLATITAAVDSLLADPTREVRPHRQRHLPVRVVGLVEARLEQVDRLILAGLAQDVFPGRLARPLLLSDPVRRALDLEHWRARAGRDAELFLRLLHGASQVTMTWPAERDAQPALPSPLVQRLAMMAPGELVAADEPLLYRRAVSAASELSTREVAFRQESEPVPAPEVAPPARLSHTSLQRYRDCPYRFLLADSLGLRRPEPLEAAFTAADHGNLAHAAMQRWLDPENDGLSALAAGDAATARATLERAATDAYSEYGRDLPGSAVALRSFLALVPPLVKYELARCRTWRPVAVEALFAVTLGAAVDWLRSVDEQPFDLAEPLRETVLRGKIDRVDRKLDNGSGAVIDYKTGVRPPRKRVAEGRQLQIHLYGLAMVCGGIDGLDGPLAMDHGGYYGLRRNDLGLPARPHLEGLAELATGVRAILTTATAILDPDEPFALVPDWSNEDAQGRLPCHTCEFRGVCRLEERDATPVLAARLAALLTDNRGGGA